MTRARLALALTVTAHEARVDALNSYALAGGVSLAGRLALLVVAAKADPDTRRVDLTEHELAAYLGMHVMIARHAFADLARVGLGIGAGDPFWLPSGPPPLASVRRR